jgi:hypothetical protein
LNNNCSSPKLIHLDISTQKDLSKLDLIELQDMKYLSPESILTSNPIDERSMIFCIGLIICELIMGKSLITANTKMNYMYELCKLFPEEKIEKQ